MTILGIQFFVRDRNTALTAHSWHHSTSTPSPPLFGVRSSFSSPRGALPLHRLLECIANVCSLGIIKGGPSAFLNRIPHNQNMLYSRKAALALGTALLASSLVSAGPISDQRGPAQVTDLHGPDHRADPVKRSDSHPSGKPPGKPLGPMQGHEDHDSIPGKGKRSEVHWMPHGQGEKPSGKPPAPKPGHNKRSNDNDEHMPSGSPPSGSPPSGSPPSGPRPSGKPPGAKPSNVKRSDDEEHQPPKPSGKPKGPPPSGKPPGAKPSNVKRSDDEEHQPPKPSGKPSGKPPSGPPPSGKPQDGKPGHSKRAEENHEPSGKPRGSPAKPSGKPRGPNRGDNSS